MPNSPYQRFLGIVGAFVVLTLLGFLVLPAFVVTIAAFNEKALLSFPPQGLSLRGLHTPSLTRTSVTASAMA